MDVNAFTVQNDITDLGSIDDILHVAIGVGTFIHSHSCVNSMDTILICVVGIYVGNIESTILDGCIEVGTDQTVSAVTLDGAAVKDTACGRTAQSSPTDDGTILVGQVGACGDAVEVQCINAGCLEGHILEDQIALSVCPSLCVAALDVQILQGQVLQSAAQSALQQDIADTFVGNASLHGGNRIGASHNLDGVASFSSCHSLSQGCITLSADLGNGLFNQDDLAVHDLSFQLVVAFNGDITGEARQVCSKVSKLASSHAGCIDNDVCLILDRANGNSCALLDDQGAGANSRTGELTGNSIGCILNDHSAGVNGIGAGSNSAVDHRTVLDGHGAAVLQLSVRTNVNIGVIDNNLALGHAKYQVAGSGENAVLQIEVKRRIHSSGRHIKCEHTGLFPNTVGHIEIECAIRIAVLAGTISIELNVSIGYIEGQVFTSEGCAGSNNQRRLNGGLVCGLGIGDSAGDVEGAAMTNNHSTSTGEFQACALTDIDGGVGILSTKIGSLCYTLKGDLAGSGDDADLLAVTVEDNAGRHSNIFGHISQQDDGVARLCSSCCICQSGVITSEAIRCTHSCHDFVQIIRSTVLVDILSHFSAVDGHGDLGGSHVDIGVTLCPSNIPVCIIGAGEGDVPGDINIAIDDAVDIVQRCASNDLVAFIDGNDQGFVRITAAFAPEGGRRSQSRSNTTLGPLDLNSSVLVNFVTVGNINSLGVTAEGTGDDLASIVGIYIDSIELVVVTTSIICVDISKGNRIAVDSSAVINQGNVSRIGESSIATNIESDNRIGASDYSIDSIALRIYGICIRSGVVLIQIKREEHIRFTCTVNSVISKGNVSAIHSVHRLYADEGIALSICILTKGVAGNFRAIGDVSPAKNSRGVEIGGTLCGLDIIVLDGDFQSVSEFGCTKHNKCRSAGNLGRINISSNAGNSQRCAVVSIDVGRAGKLKVGHCKLNVDAAHSNAYIVECLVTGNGQVLVHGDRLIRDIVNHSDGIAVLRSCNSLSQGVILGVANLGSRQLESAVLIHKGAARAYRHIAVTGNFVGSHLGTARNVDDTVVLDILHGQFSSITSNIQNGICLQLASTILSASECNSRILNVNLNTVCMCTIRLQITSGSQGRILYGNRNIALIGVATRVVNPHRSRGNSSTILCNQIAR